jgi:hypothetical protein
MEREQPCSPASWQPALRFHSFDGTPQCVLSPQKEAFSAGGVQRVQTETRHPLPKTPRIPKEPKLNMCNHIAIK